MLARLAGTLRPDFLLVVPRIKEDNSRELLLMFGSTLPSDAILNSRCCGKIAFIGAIDGGFMVNLNRLARVPVVINRARHPASLLHHLRQFKPLEALEPCFGANHFT